MFTSSGVARLLKLFCCVAIGLFVCSHAGAAIREFPIRTVEKLGRQLYVQTQSPQKLTEAQQRAKRAAVGARPQLEKQGYRFAVLSDPERQGYLVYALATSRNARDVVVGLHYRFSVSPEGKVQRVDPLARNANVISGSEC